MERDTEMRVGMLLHRWRSRQEGVSPVMEIVSVFFENCNTNALLDTNIASGKCFCHELVHREVL